MTDSAGVFLDEPFSNGVIVQAIKEGLIATPYAEVSDYWRSVSALGSVETVRSEALTYLLLFERAHMFGFDMPAPQPLIDAGLVQFTSVDRSEVDLVSEARELKGLALEELAREGRPLDPASFEDLVPDLAPSSLYDLTERSVRPAINEMVLRLAPLLGRQIPPDIAAAEPTSVQADALTADARLKRVSALQQSVLRVSRLIRAGRQLQVPIASRHRRTCNDYLVPSPPSQPQDAWQAVQVFLSEVEVLPRVSSIADVLRLRNDRRLQAFREVILEWADALARDVGAEARVRSEIRKANEDLKSLGRWEKVGGWLTWASVPLAVVGALAGTPLGLITAPIGTGIRTYGVMQKRKYAWLLFGSR